MRVHVSLEEDLVEEIDRVTGSRGRSAYIARAIVLDTSVMINLLRRRPGANERLPCLQYGE